MYIPYYRIVHYDYQPLPNTYLRFTNSDYRTLMADKELLFHNHKSINNYKYSLLDKYTFEYAYHFMDK